MNVNIQTVANFQQYVQGQNALMQDQILTLMMSANILITFANKQKIGRQSGDQIYMTRPELAPYSTLNTQDGAGGTMLTSNESIYMGRFLLYTVAMLISSDAKFFFKSNGNSNWSNKVEQMRTQILQSITNGMELNLMTTLINGCSNRIKGSGGTPTGGIAGKMQVADLQAGVQLLYNNNVARYFEPIEPTANYSTRGTTETFLFICPANYVVALKTLGIVQPSQYGAGSQDRISTYEVGVFSDLLPCTARIFTSTLQPFNTPNESGEYKMFMMGQEAISFLTNDSEPQEQKKGKPIMSPKSRLQDAFGIAVSITQEPYNAGSLADPLYHFGQGLFANYAVAAMTTSVQGSILYEATI